MLYAMSRTFQFHDFDREVLLTYSEYLQVAEYGLLSFGMPVNFDTQEVALVLPVKLTLPSPVSKRCDGTKIFLGPHSQITRDRAEVDESKEMDTHLCYVEQIFGPQDCAIWEAHQRYTCGLIRHFGCPIS